MDLLDAIVEVHGIISRKELNGQYGIATAYDDAKGRVAVRLLSDRSMVSLKAANLSDWAAARRDVATKISTDDIDVLRCYRGRLGTRTHGVWVTLYQLSVFYLFVAGGIPLAYRW